MGCFSCVKSWGLSVVLGAILGSTPAFAAESSFTPAQRAEIEQLVHDYLVQHPEVMYEVAAEMEKLQQKQAADTLQEVVQELRTRPSIPKQGPADAEHYIIEFFDYNCGYCKVVRKLTEQLAAKHNMQAVYIEFPILSAQSVQAAAVGMALYALDPDKYFAYQNLLMEQGKKIESFADIEDALKAVGADIEAVKQKAGTDSLQDDLRFNLEQGKRLGVTGTPFFIIDGKVLRGAVPDYASLERFAGFAE